MTGTVCCVRISNLWLVQYKYCEIIGLIVILFHLMIHDHGLNCFKDRRCGQGFRGQEPTLYKLKLPLHELKYYSCTAGICVLCSTTDQVIYAMCDCCKIHDRSETVIFQAKSHDVVRYLNVVRKSKNWESTNHPVLVGAILVQGLTLGVFHCPQWITWCKER